MSELGNLIKKARGERGWSQKKLGEKLGNVPQGTISAWELGRQRPEQREILDKLAECLNIDRQKLAAAYEAQSPEENSLEPDESVAFTEQQKYIEGIGKENTEIWLLGPSTLPVIESSKVREIWAENLSRGTTYCIIWYLNFVSSDIFTRIAPALYDVENRLKKLQQKSEKTDQEKNLNTDIKQENQSEPLFGKINHYATVISLDISLKDKIDSYKALQEDSLKNNLNNMIFHSPKQVNILELLQYSNPYGALTLCRHRWASLFITPLLHISLSSVKTRPVEVYREKPKRVFYFLPEEQANKLNRLITDYIQSYYCADEIDNKLLFDGKENSSVVKGKMSSNLID